MGGEAKEQASLDGRRPAAEGEPGWHGHAIVGERLTLAAFGQLAATLAGIPFVKLLVDKEAATIHFMDNVRYQFHSDYIAETLLGIPAAEMDKKIDEFNRSIYVDPNRRFYVGMLALHKRAGRQFFSLETVEVDVMDAEMIRFFYRFVREWLDPSVPLFFKPANHHQEETLSGIDTAELPRVYAREIFETSPFVALNPGEARGRLRLFRSEAEYREKRPSVEWYDIVVMERVPDSIPRVSGIINSRHTTPLSHTNVLASGWQIPNAIQIGVSERIEREKLDGAWVEYAVKTDAAEIHLRKTERPREADQRPSWSAHKIEIEEPELTRAPIVPLGQLRMSHAYRYGTKAANLGELEHVLANGSERLTGFHRVPRPPRDNLLMYLAKFLRKPEEGDLEGATTEFLRSFARVPRGIAVPFSVQQEFLESSPKIQQAIGKLKMGLELNARQTDALSVSLQQMIVQARMPDTVRNYIDAEISKHLGGISSFVVRSSSNAEDLQHFSAAGIYESINHVTDAATIFESIKRVWASLVSPRSVRLRQEVGISLDASYMGVVVQEEIRGRMGGVMVTTNPTNRNDFRNVYFNVSTRSVEEIVQGVEPPYQYLYNTVEGGGRTLSIGTGREDLPAKQKAELQKLAFVGRFLQSHFSPDYTFASPVDIEWLQDREGRIFLLQLRPYAS